MGCCRENDTSGVIDTTFSVEHNAYGAIQVHDLKPDGRNVAVNEDNKREYVRYLNNPSHGRLTRRLIRLSTRRLRHNSHGVTFDVAGHRCTGSC